MAEGTVVLRQLLAARRFGIESLLILENRLEGLGDLLPAVPADVPVYVASRDVLDSVAGFPMHRGVIGIGLRGTVPTLPEALDQLSETATLVVCIGIANHDNIGAIFRNAAAFGADAVLIDKTCCDPLYRKAIRVSVGAALTVPFHAFDDAETLTSLLAERGFRQFALTPAGDVDIRSQTRAERTAIYLGSEGQGLPSSLVSRLIPTRISMAPNFDSLNVAAASAIALHHLRAPQGPVRQTPEEAAAEREYGRPD